MSHQALTPQQQRDHKATLWRNIRRNKHWCEEHYQTLLRVYAPLLSLKLPRIPKPKL